MPTFFACASKAVNSGLRVLGIYDGYHHLAKGETSHVTELRIEDVSRIHATGGSILRTSRTNPARSEADMKNVLDSLRRLNIGSSYSDGSIARVSEVGDGPDESGPFSLAGQEKTIMPQANTLRNSESTMQVNL